MKYSTSRIAAFWLGVVSALVGVVGVVVSIILAIGAATLLARLTLLFGGLLATALVALLAFALSQLLYILSDMADAITLLVGLTRDKGQE